MTTADMTAAERERSDRERQRSDFLRRPTTDSASERFLASALGYPDGWHVVRKQVQVPVPRRCLGGGGDGDAKESGADENGGVEDPDMVTMEALQDRIYAASPDRNPDCYFNHSAAMRAALRWDPDKSTPYSDNGGQLLEMRAQFEASDEVEVFYEPDGTWYEATIVKKTVYEDDIRYTVHYTEEDATQSNVCDDQIRPRKGKGKKSKSKAKAAKNEKAAGKTAAKKGRAGRHEPSAEELALATEFGLPKGWSVKSRPKSKFDVRDPKGRLFRSKKAAYEFLGMEAPTVPTTSASKQSKQKKAAKPKGKKRKATADDGEAVDDAVDDEEDVVPEQEEDDEEGDPPWRKTGHEYLGRKVRWRTSGGQDDPNATYQTGTVTGWIADTDVDQEGNPGFVSDRTGESAALFHVKFDDYGGGKKELSTTSPLYSQDLEEYELEDSLLDEDEVPLSTMVSNKHGGEKKKKARA